MPFDYGKYQKLLAELLDGELLSLVETLNQYSVAGPWLAAVELECIVA